MNDSPSVMQDFVFGVLESDANTLSAERNRWSGIRHSYDIDPLDPLPGQPVTITVTVGRDVLVDHVTAYVTIDGSEPAGSRGQVKAALPSNSIELTPYSRCCIGISPRSGRARSPAS